MNAAAKTFFALRLLAFGLGAQAETVQTVVVETVTTTIVRRAVPHAMPQAVLETQRPASGWAFRPVILVVPYAPTTDRLMPR